MLAAEPEKIRQFVGQVKDHLTAYHRQPVLSQLSLVPLPLQTKTDQWERTFEAVALIKLSPGLSKMLPHSLTKKGFEAVAEEFAKYGLFHESIVGPATDLMSKMITFILQMTIESEKEYARTFDAPSMLKMNRLLWCLAFFQLEPFTTSKAIHPFSALYPLLDDFLDSPVYSKLNKTRLMERIHRKLTLLFSENNQFTPEASGEFISKNEAALNRCIDDLCVCIVSLDPFSKRRVIESLDTLRYAEELDYLQNKETDAYTRCAIKGISTLSTLLLLNGTEANIPDRLIMTFGFIFQMIDDLQDCQEDAAVNIQTPFSAPIQISVNLDSEIIKLIQFLRSDHLKNMITDCSHLSTQLSLLKEMLLCLVMEAAVKHRNHCSVQFYKDLRHRLPVTKRWLKKHSLEAEAFNWFRSISRCSQMT